MSDTPVTRRIALQTTATLTETGDLQLCFPALAGQQVEVILLVAAPPPAGVETLPAAPHESSAPVLQTLTEEEGVDPRRVSEALRELSDELITRYETLFGVERQPDDKANQANPDSDQS